MSRTCQLWLDGDHYVLRDEEIDRMLEIGQDAPSVEQAWRDLEAYCEARADE